MQKQIKIMLCLLSSRYFLELKLKYFLPWKNVRLLSNPSLKKYILEKNQVVSDTTIFKDCVVN